MDNFYAVFKREKRFLARRVSVAYHVSIVYVCVCVYTLSVCIIVDQLHSIMTARILYDVRDWLVCALCNAVIG